MGFSAKQVRIFGFDGWSRKTIDPHCVLTRENCGTFLPIYAAKVFITVQAAGATIIREGHGSGEGRGPSLVRSTILPSKPQKPTQPNARLRPLANHLDWSCTGKAEQRRSWPIKANVIS